MSRILNKIFSDFPKEEVNLSKESIELSIVGDLKKGLSEANSIIKKGGAVSDKIDKLRSTYNSLVQDGKSLRQNGLDIIKGIESDTNRAQSMAKELGVDPKEITGYSDALDAGTQLFRITNLLNHDEA